MGKLIPTSDEIKLLLALRRHKNRGNNLVLINVVTHILWPLGKGETTATEKSPLDKKVVTA